MRGEGLPALPRSAVEAVEAPAAAAEAPDIPAPPRPTGYWNLIWRRLRRDTFAVVGGSYVLFVLAMCFVIAPIASRLLGHGPDSG